MNGKPAVHPASRIAHPASVQLFRLKVTEKELRERVEKFRLAVAHRGMFRPRGRALYDLLVRPAQSLVDKAQRVLICPDGPLHTLPFAALVEVRGSKGRGEEERYFVEAKPLHVIVSMTVYAQIRKQTQSSHTPTPPHSHTLTLLALGDPAYEANGEAAERAAREFATRGVKLTRLPHTRKEVEAIGRLYGQQARVRVGKEANETAAKQESGGARALHFACHGLLDNREPLNSGLVLTATGGEDGILQAWEIFEGVRFKADLVVLSACETRLGGETKNEGIVGLTRALQYAGARSVVVSLWKIVDESTARLMVELYRQRKARKSKDEAPRAAQLTLPLPMIGLVALNFVVKANHSSAPIGVMGRRQVIQRGDSVTYIDPPHMTNILSDCISSEAPSLNPYPLPTAPVVALTAPIHFQVRFGGLDLLQMTNFARQFDSALFGNFGSNQWNNDWKLPQ